MKNSRHVGLLDFLAITETADIALAVFPGIRAVCIYYLVCRVAVHARVPLHLAQICGRCLSRISLPGCRRRTACRVDTYQMTVSPRPKSSVRPHADGKLRPVASFVPTTILLFIA